MNEVFQEQEKAQKQKSFLELKFLNSLIFKESASKIADLSPKDKNIELKFIILAKVETVSTKIGKLITKFHVADSSGSILLNVFDECTSSAG